MHGHHFNQAKQESKGEYELETKFPRMGDMSRPGVRLFVLRHGDVSPPPGCTVYGDLNVPLSELGRRQSKAAAMRLASTPVDAIWSSDLTRAVVLGDELGKLHPAANRRADPRLREIHRGHWAGLSTQEIERSWPGALQRYHASQALLAPPGGESIAQQASRVRAALDDVALQYSGGSVAVCAHLWVLRIVAVTARGQNIERVIEHNFDKCAQLEVRWSANPRRVSWLGCLQTPELDPVPDA